MESPKSNFEEFFLSFVMYCLLCSVRLQFEDLNANVKFFSCALLALVPEPQIGQEKVMLGTVWFLVPQNNSSVYCFCFQGSLQTVLAFLEQSWVSSLPLESMPFH